MKHLLASVFALTLLATPALEALDWTPVAEKLRESIVSLTYDTDGGCSGFVIDKNRNHVLTAAHCDADAGKKLYVDQIPAEVVAKEVKQDLMVLRVPGIGEDHPAVRLAPKDPLIGQEVASYGFGYALEKPLFRVTHVSDNDTRLDGSQGGPFIVIDAAFVPGQSGGPVFDHSGAIVAIVQMSSDRVGIGVGAEIIKNKVGRYFERESKP